VQLGTYTKSGGWGDQHWPSSWPNLTLSLKYPRVSRWGLIVTHTVTGVPIYRQISHSFSISVLVFTHLILLSKNNLSNAYPHHLSLEYPRITRWGLIVTDTVTGVPLSRKIALLL